MNRSEAARQDRIDSIRLAECPVRPLLKSGFTERIVERGVTLSNGVKVAVMQIFEFADAPHLCRKTYEAAKGKIILRDGALYVRPRRVPETSEVADSVEMRDVLDLATEKALRRYLATAERAGGVVLPGSSDPGRPSTEELYDAQRSEAWE